MQQQKLPGPPLARAAPAGHRPRGRRQRALEPKALKLEEPKTNRSEHDAWKASLLCASMLFVLFCCFRVYVVYVVLMLIRCCLAQACVYKNLSLSQCSYVVSYSYQRFSNICFTDFERRFSSHTMRRRNLTRISPDVRQNSPDFRQMLTGISP